MESNKIWNVEYTDEADLDLDDIFHYIADVLLEPSTARNQVQCARVCKKAIRPLTLSLPHFTSTS